MLSFLNKCTHVVLAIQAHHLPPDRLADVQHTALDMGWKGVRAAARSSGQGEGNQCGLAILAPARVPITQPPFLPAPSFADGRAVAGRVRWG
eukprot:1171773-Pyramimonas_sp.AAC.1